MKQTFVKGIVGAALVASLAACADTFEPGGGDKGTGQISPAVGVNTAVVSSRQSRAEAADVTADMLSLKLTAADGSEAGSWNNVADFDVNAKFNVGDYTLEAFYGNEDTEGFESPYFYGSTTLKVVENQTTRVNLTATLANAMVSVLYTPEFIDYMADYSAEVHSAGGAYTFYAKDETRPVYVKPGDVEISVSLTKPNGMKGSIKAATIHAEARHHYRVTFDVNNGSGDAVLVVKFDDTLEQEDVLIDLSDELFNAPAPELIAEGFSDGQTIAFVPGKAPSAPIKANIIARGGLAEVVLTVQSASLEAQGWPGEVNLITAAENIRQRLTGLGLQCRGIYNKPDQMAVIDFTNVLAHIQTVEGGNNISTFALKVVDRLGKTCETPLTFKAEATPLEISLSNPGLFMMGASELEIDLNYNGGDPAKAVTIQYKNERNTWSNAAATFTASGDGVYRVTITGLPESANDLVLRAVVGNKTSAEFTVTRTAIELQAKVNTNDVFAKHATVSVNVIGSAEGLNLAAILGQCDVKISSDGGSTYTTAAATAEGTSYRLTGLTPGTTYKVKIEVPGAANDAEPATMTTEAAAQLANSNMEEWTSTAHKSNMVEYFVGGNVWDTLNGLTISQWNNGGILAIDAAYRASSGTIPTSDTPSGQGNAALIRTIGWGHGTTASGNLSIIKHVDRGELFLGKWNGGGENNVMPDYGVTFNSRPSALTFSYKFSEVNSRKGYAEITILDAAGNELATNSFEISAQSSYVKKTLSLEYKAGAAKAASIRIIFRSTAPGISLGKADVKTVYGSSNTHVGSQLYIDDVELIY